MEKDTLAIQTSPSDGIFDFRQPNDPSPLDLSVRIKVIGNFNKLVSFNLTLILPGLF